MLVTEKIREKKAFFRKMKRDTMVGAEEEDIKEKIREGGRSISACRLLNLG